MKTLSIITINKNNASGLQRTLESLGSIHKYNEHLEAIFIDGNSTDSSIDLARSFYKPSLFHVQADSGPYEAMNNGLQIAEGKYSFWLNSGDELLPECLPNLIPILQKSESSIVCCGSIFVDSCGSTIEEKYSGKWQLPYSSPNHQSVFINTSLAKDVDGYNTKYRIAADRDLILKVLSYNDMLSEHRLLVSRYYVGGLSSDSALLRKEQLLISRKYLLISRPRFIAEWLRIYKDTLLRNFHS
jgi:glycosyltransferase involved in cell wall biosynthesis